MRPNIEYFNDPEQLLNKMDEYEDNNELYICYFTGISENGFWCKDCEKVHPLVKSHVLDTTNLPVIVG